MTTGPIVRIFMLSSINRAGFYRAITHQSRYPTFSNQEENFVVRNLDYICRQGLAIENHWRWKNITE